MKRNYAWRVRMHLRIAESERTSFSDATGKREMYITSVNTPTVMVARRISHVPAGYCLRVTIDEKSQLNFFGLVAWM